jgi:hypothetical protein
MAAIEYGSYYWCVILERSADRHLESVHVHADEMEIDERGALVFRSAGRRPAGTAPQQHDAGQKTDKHGSNGNSEEAMKGQEGTSKKGDNEKKKLMTYLAFAPGTWAAVYAAKLKDGSAAAVEHWNVADGKPGLLAAVPSNAGAESYFPTE